MNDLREELKAYLDGELSPARMREIDEALAKSAELRTEVSQLRSLSAVLNSEVKPVQVLGMEQTLIALATDSPKVSFWNHFRVWTVRVCLAGAISAVVFVPAYFNRNEFVTRDATKSMVATNMSMAKSVESAAVPETAKKAVATGVQIYSGPPEAPAKTATTEAAKAAAPVGPMAVPPVTVSPLPGMASSGTVPPMNLDVVPIEGPVGPPVSGDVAAQEKAVRVAVKEAGATVMASAELSNGGVKTKTLTISADPEMSEALLQRLRNLVGPSGTVKPVTDEASMKASSRSSTPNSPAAAAFGGGAGGFGGAGSAPAVAQEPAARKTSGNQNFGADAASNLGIDARSLAARLETLQKQRATLLEQFYADAKPVKEVDAEIEAVQKALDAARARSNANSKRLITVILQGAAVQSDRLTPGNKVKNGGSQ